MGYHHAAPTGFKAMSAGDNKYTAQEQFGFGGARASWRAAGTWTIGGRTGQPVISLDVVSKDAGETFGGSVTYAREGPIRFKATRKASYAEKESSLSSSVQLAVLDGVKLSIDNISNLTGGDRKPLGSLYVSLRIRDPKLTGVKGIRAVLRESRDEDGVLLRHDLASNNIFSDLIKPSGSRRRVEGNYSVAFGLDL